jgi:hypothetical protein
LLDPKYITTAYQVWLYHQLNLSHQPTDHCLLLLQILAGTN